jgi:hypothetical protein
MSFLKQHRKGILQIEGRKLTGNFNVSLTNQGDREMLIEFISEMRKQLLKFNPTKKKKLKKKRKLKKIKRK